jgi:hypothetical protein
VQKKSRKPSSWPVVAAVALSSVGAMNAPELQKYVSLDLTLLAMLLATVVVVASVAMQGLHRGTAYGLVMAATWIPASLTTHLNAYGSEKTIQIFTVGLLSVVLGCQLGPAPEFLSRVAKGFAAFGVVVAVAMLLLGNTSPQGRLTLFDLNPIGIGRITGLAAVILLLSLPGQSPPHRLVAAGLATLTAYVTFETQSQAPFGAIFIATAIAVFLKRERRAGSVIAVLGLGTVLMMSAGSVVERLTTSAQQDVSSLDRLELYRASWDIFTDHPGGIGWGNLWNYLPPTAVVRAQGIEQHSHNMILEVATEGGFIALLGLLVALAAGLAGVMSHAASSGDRRVLGMWLFAVSIAMTSGNLPGNRLTMLMLGVGIGLYAASRSTDKGQRAAS